MLRNVFIPMVLLASLLAGCSGGTVLRATDKAHEARIVATHCDVPEAGVPGRIRFYVDGLADVGMVYGEWKINGQTYTSRMRGADVVVIYDQNGSYSASFRGVDRNGNDCTGPRVKFSARSNANAEPVLVIDAPQFAGAGEGTHADGTSYRYHEWRWSSLRSYDPDGKDPFVDIDWELWTSDHDGNKLERIAHKTDCVAFNGDTDGDGYEDIIVLSSDPPEFEHLMVRFAEADVAADEMLILSVQGTTEAGFRKGWDGCIYGNGTPSRPIKK